METPLAAWESFYVIVGSSSAALTGLMFVVITLGVERQSGEMPHAVAAFGTPTVVHFCAAFLVSAICSAPWHTVSMLRLLAGLIGIAGVVYGLIVVRRTRRQTVYRPVLEDWVWHVVIPMLSYAVLAISAFALRDDSLVPLFSIAATTLLLILAGIHNAWDAVTYNAQQLRQNQSSQTPDN